MIALYRGFGWAGRVFVHGRVVEREPITPAAHDSSRWSNLVAMLRRIDADPIGGAIVSIRVGSTSQVLTTDDEGFFATWLEVSDPERVDEEWVRVHAELVAPHVHGVPPVSEGRALVPATRPSMVVISDVDDTVLQSNVTNLIAAMRTMLLENARTRLPFPGVAAFYQALRRGAAASEQNPVFYVSSSPWNLHDVISEFLETQAIPAGPVMLRDVDLGLDVFTPHHHHVHKREMCRRVLDTFADVPAILIGDSGQQDPEIYRDVVRAFPGRIRAVYIRNVSTDPARTAAVRRLSEDVLAAGSSLVLADDTMAAARHAAEQGWIDKRALVSVAEERGADEGTVPGNADASGARSANDPPAPIVSVE